MGSEKMTDILVSTSAFIATLTYPAKKSRAGSNFEVILEIIPIVQSATKDIGLAERFFEVICADSSPTHRRKKANLLRSFIEACPKKISDEFWDGSHWRTLEGLCLRISSITCLLYDRAGNVVKEAASPPIDILWALQRIEEAFFITQGTPLFHNPEHSKKEFRRDSNRETHKYFLHHRAA